MRNRIECRVIVVSVAFSFCLVCLILNRAESWNLLNHLLRDEPIGLPMRQLVLTDSRPQVLSLRELGPGLFVVRVQGIGVSVSDGAGKSLRGRIAIDEGREMNQECTVYGGYLKADISTFSQSFLESVFERKAMTVEIEQDANFPRLTVSVFRAR